MTSTLAQWKMSRPLYPNERKFRRLAAEAEIELHEARDHLAKCEAAPQQVGGAELMKARQRRSAATVKYSAAMREYGAHLINPAGATESDVTSSRASR
jgi:hypothetical protein